MLAASRGLRVYVGSVEWPRYGISGGILRHMLFDTSFLREAVSFGICRRMAMLMLYRVSFYRPYIYTRACVAGARYPLLPFRKGEGVWGRGAVDFDGHSRPASSLPDCLDASI